MSGSDTTSARHVFGAFLKLGLTSFGGPVAHLGYFRDEFVVRRRWLDDRAYGDLVALSQFTMYKRADTATRPLDTRPIVSESHPIPGRHGTRHRP